MIDKFRKFAPLLPVFVLLALAAFAAVPFNVAYAAIPTPATALLDGGAVLSDTWAIFPSLSSPLVTFLGLSIAAGMVVLVFRLAKRMAPR